MPILTGLIMWLGFDFPNVPILVIGFAVLVFLSVKAARQPIEALLAGTIAGTVYSLGFLAWHWAVLPLDWAGIPNSTVGGLLIFYAWFLPSLLIGIYFGVWSWGTHKFKGNYFYLSFWALLGWPALEFFRAVDLSFLWSGNGGLVGPYWTVGYLGYALADWPATLVLAQWGGVYLLSGLVALAGTALYLLYAKNKKVALAAMAILIICGSLFGQKDFIADNLDVVPVAVATTYFPSFSRLSPEEYQALKERKLAVYQQLRGLPQALAITIFPEDSRMILDLGENAFTEPTLYLDSGRVMMDDGSVHLAFSYLNGKTGTTTLAEKRFLTPHGEYMPYLTDLLGGVIGKNEWVKSFRQNRGTSPGRRGVMVNWQGLKLQATACSEVMIPTWYAAAAADGVSFLINTASHSLFRGSRQLYGQTVRMAQVRAAESGRAFIQSSNFVPSFLISPNGKVLWESKWGEEGVNLVHLPLAKKTTLYSRLAALFSPPNVLK